ncbi:unnamed protein product [Closterium sp. NIES-54]
MPLSSAAERDGRAGDAYDPQDCVDNAALHGRQAPLVAPYSAPGRLGAQLPQTGVSAFGDDAARAVVREETRLDAGVCVGLHGAVHGPRAAEPREAGAKGPIGPSSRSVAEEQGLGGARPHRQQSGHDRRGQLLRGNVAEDGIASATGNEGSIAASPLTPASGIAGDRHDKMHLGGQVQNLPRTGERRAEESAEVKTTGERRAEESAEAKSAKEPTAEEKLVEEPTAEDQLDDDASSDIVEALGGKEGE